MRSQTIKRRSILVEVGAQPRLSTRLLTSIHKIIERTVLSYPRPPPVLEINSLHTSVIRAHPIDRRRTSTVQEESDHMKCLDIQPVSVGFDGTDNSLPLIPAFQETSKKILSGVIIQEK